MDLDSLISEVGGRLGLKHAEHLGPTCPQEAERFALACGLDVAVQSGAVHPLFAPSQMSWGAGPRSSDIRPDGTPPWVSMGLPLEGFRVMGAGQRLTFHRPVAAEADVAVESWVEGATVKEGRRGPMLVLEVARDFLHDQQLVAECRESIIVRPK